MLNIPFYPQETKNECGPRALQMILQFLSGKRYDVKQLIDLTESEESGATWTGGIAKAAGQLGFKVEFYSKSLGFNPENVKLDFYKTETNVSDAQNKTERLTKEALKAGVKMQERILSQDEILSRINKDCTAIVLLDWGKIAGKDTYQGHFVPIIGYDEENVYVHNQGLGNPQAKLAIKKELFESARKALGTDEDILFISNK